MNAMIRWMTEHPVAANLTMIFVVAVGILSALSIPQKTFPEFTLDQVQVSVRYPGASPQEIEQSIIRPLEDQLSGIEGVDEMTATATEGNATVTLELALGQDVAKRLDEVKTEVDRITVFPEDAEEPSVTQASNRSRVLEINIHGTAPERALKEYAERLKDQLVELPGVSYVQVANTRAYEISVEVDRETLNAYGLTLGQVARIIEANSLELPGGQIETDTLTIPLRTLGRNFTKADFDNIVVLSDPDTGARVHLRDIARVVDGFEDTDLSARFGGAPMATVNVFRVGEEQVLTVVEQVRGYLDTFRATLPEGVDVTIWQNDAEELQGRIDLLTENAILGMLLVVICLALFLDFRLAFWSAVGIAVSFVASFIVMGLMGMSINMISLFGFILAIGIVVDNAIVVGENIYTKNEDGAPPQEAAVKGTQRVAVPVIFSTLTTIVAFTPLLQLPGVLGKFLGDIPTVVIIVLTLSLIQSLIILPRNLSRLNIDPKRKRNILVRGLDRVRGRIDRGLRGFIDGPFDRALRFATRRFLIPIAATVALMFLTVGLLAHGYVKFTFFPSIEGKFVTAEIEMADGTTFARTEAVARQLQEAAVRAGAAMRAKLPEGHPPVLEDVNVIVGRSPASGGPTASAGQNSGALAHVVARVLDPERRDFPTADFEAAWRAEIGQIAGVKKLSLTAAVVNAGDAIALEMSMPDGVSARPALDAAREALAGLPGVFDIQDDLSAGRLEYRLVLKPEARIYGLSLQDLAVQMRNGFFGVEATRVQRGRDDVRVFVRLPKEQRDSVADLLATKVRTGAGDLIPLSLVADIEEGLAPTQILRRDGRTINTLTADVNPAVITGAEANEWIRTELLPRLTQEYEGLTVAFGGEQRTQGDAGAALGQALGVALFVIFALLALIFRSYVQPIVVMVAIPLGLIGAVLGHLIMGLSITLLSIFGIIGLAGVVINNSLVMLDLYNEYLMRGMDTVRAVIKGTKDRFRPILLTSLTTFLGIFPLITETSLQAQFLIPLAVSIGFGVLFGTVIILLAIPAVFIAQAKLFRTFVRPADADSPAEGETAPAAGNAAQRGKAPVGPPMRLIHPRAAE